MGLKGVVHCSSTLTAWVATLEVAAVACETAEGATWVLVTMVEAVPGDGFLRRGSSDHSSGPWAHPGVCRMRWEAVEMASAAVVVVVDAVPPNGAAADAAGGAAELDAAVCFGG